MISTCILPNIESVTALSPKSAVDSPHENLNRFIEIAWMFIETNHGKVLSLFFTRNVKSSTYLIQFVSFDAEFRPFSPLIKL